MEHNPGSKNTAVDCLSRRPYKPEQEEGEQNPRELEDIPDPREIIEITFGDSMIKQVDNLEENVYIQDNTLDEDREDIIENQETETENDKTQLYEMDELKRKEIIKLQQQCPNFKNIYNFLKEGTLPDDQKRAYAIPY